ncbi:PCKGM carboxykinase, partial [Nycticryphes semicollaris]|nr:PCKGM carboxykinase [Nycticryphes semicollaris]
FLPCLNESRDPLTTLPSPEPLVSHWPCDPARTLVAHEPDRRRIVSFGSGYGGNSLLGKKCFALRIASRLARDQGWLAEHMLVGYRVGGAGSHGEVSWWWWPRDPWVLVALVAPVSHVLGDPRGPLRPSPAGRLRAINPESGFFGVAPGTSEKTNPMAMATIRANTIFTNVGQSSDGGVYWEGMDQSLPPGTTFTSWLGKPWSPGRV